MVTEGRVQGLGERHPAVLGALGISDHDLSIVEIDVLNPGTTLTKVYATPGLGVKEEESDGKRKFLVVNAFHALASTEDRFTLPHKLEPGDVWKGWLSVKLMQPTINDMETVLIKAVDERGKKIVHETWIPRDWRERSGT